MDVVLRDYKIVDLFAKPLYCVNTNFLSMSGLVEKIKNLNYERTEIDNGWYTNEKDILLNFPELRESILNEFNYFKRDKLKILNEFDIVSSWALKHSPGDESHVHNHQNSCFSGVLYIQTYENSGGIKFHNFTPSGFNFSLEVEDGVRSYENKGFVIKPRSGQMIMFPSDLYHSVERNESEHDRYCIAFNFFPKEINDEGPTRQINLKLV